MKNPSREYLKELPIEKRKELAEKLGIRQEYLYQIGMNLRSPSRELAIMLELSTNGRVREADFVSEIRSNLEKQDVA